MCKMKKKALIIAPHPDDEINLAGQVIPYFNENNVDTYVLYITNGDYSEKIGNTRILEALKANKILGIKEDRVFFLGYANEWNGTHIYDTNGQVELVSYLGKTITNGIEGHAEYCYQRFGLHHTFTRDNLKNDLKHFVVEISADLIICNDFDSHPDHRATTLIFDEIMGEIISELDDYHPIVLKKYAYNGVWKGEKDFYSRPLNGTVLKQPFDYSGGTHELESPFFGIENAICIPAHPSTITRLITTNIVYAAAKQHKSTVAWYQMLRVINSDVIYWKRNTKNLLPKAHVKVSSGNADFLFDFKLYDSGNVLDRIEPFDKKEYAWRPEANDEKKELQISFKQKSFVKRINIYSDFDSRHKVKKIYLNLDNREFLLEFNDDILKSLILEKPISVEKIEIRIIEGNDGCGITEIEVLEDETDLSFMEYFRTNEVAKNRSSLFVPISYLEKMYLDIKFLMLFKIKYEICRRLNKNES